MAGNCIINDDVVKKASKEEIIRRYYQILKDKVNGKCDDDVIYKMELIMKQAGVSCSMRSVVQAAADKAEKTQGDACAIQLVDGRIITGKTSQLLGASSAALLNALKEIANIEDEAHLISPAVIEPLQELKTNHLGNKNPRLHMDETLIALSICAASDEKAKKALDGLNMLKHAEAHSTVMLSQVDENIFKKLGINLTCDAVYSK